MYRTYWNHKIGLLEEISNWMHFKNCMSIENGIMNLYKKATKKNKQNTRIGYIK
jgi:hypothetical protein